MEHILDSEDEKIYCFTIHKLSEYIFTNGIEVLILPDRSARVAYLGVIKFLKSKHPDFIMPRIIFLNLDGIRNGFDQKNTTKLLDSGNLFNKNAKILLFDTCIHDGDTMSTLLDFFHRYGYQNIVIGAGHSSSYSDCKVSPDFVIFDNDDVTCYPFGGRGSNLVKTYSDSIYSTINTNTYEFNKGVALRKQINHLMSRYLHKDKKDQIGFVYGNVQKYLNSENKHKLSTGEY